MHLRPYQQTCVDRIVSCENGGHLIIMATGTGKTLTMAEGLRARYHEEPVLWLAHRTELVEQAMRVVPRNVFCETVQTAVRRMDKYHDFSVIVIDEAHHAAAPTYRKILDYFCPDMVFGLTATPNRADGTTLSETFQDILFEYNLLVGVDEGYLVRPKVRQVRTGLDLDGIKSRLGDYDPKELERAVNTEARNGIIKRIVAESPKPCMVFAVDVAHAEAIAALIPGAVKSDGKTPEKVRRGIYNDFISGKLEVLVNCMLYTEGTDFPNMKTVVLARPTQSQLLYIQMAGRVLRTYPDKTEGLIVDLVDSTSKFPPCQAPTLIGLDPVHVSTGKTIELSGDLLDDIPEVLERAYSSFEAIVRSDKILADWAKRNKVDTRNIGFFRKPDGSLYLSVPDRSFSIPAPKLNEPMSVLQGRIDEVYRALCRDHKDCQSIWNKRFMAGWGAYGATDAQRRMVRQFNANWDRPTLTRGDASRLISHITSRRKRC